ncbi:hypothetical protein SALWKB2_2026 [Snodgrassella alvi wkB2]|nr:hypothetical protein SALWKB2_2026 [Snodgrassella alvi wkB2]
MIASPISRFLNLYLLNNSQNRNTFTGFNLVFILIMLNKYIYHRRC